MTEPATTAADTDRPAVQVTIETPPPAVSFVDGTGLRIDIPPVPGCNASIPEPGTVRNGVLDDSQLCSIGNGHKLHPDAAAAFLALDAAHHNATGERLCVTDSYRSLGAQINLAARKPHLAARPGTSQHGWGMAVDLGCGVQAYDTGAHEWLVEHAPAYGWVNPPWARVGGSKPEPWHWEFQPAVPS